MSQTAGGSSRVDNMTGVTDGSVIVHGNRIHYLTAGDGDRTLVLLHGGIIDAADISWGELIEPLSEKVRVIVPDLLGYGESDLPDEPLGVDRHVETIAGFLTEMDLEDVVLGGVSLGGGIALGIGLDYPDRVAQIVAVDAYGLGSDLSSGLLTWILAKVQVTNFVSVALMRRSRGFVSTSLAGLAAEDSSIPESAIDRVMREVRREKAGAGFRSFRAQEVTFQGYRTVFADRLDELTVPVRFIHGAEDDLFPAEWAERAAERAPDGEVFVLENCGHLSTLERPDRIRELILDVI